VGLRRHSPFFPHAPMPPFETPASCAAGVSVFLGFSALRGTETGCRADSVRGRLPFIEEEKHYELDYANSRRNLHRA
jgi:hypothetical protein